MSNFKNMKVIKIDDVWWRTAAHVEKANLDLRDEVNYPLSEGRQLSKEELINTYESILQDVKAARNNVHCLKDALESTIDDLRGLIKNVQDNETLDVGHHREFAEAVAENLDDMVT